MDIAAIIVVAIVVVAIVVIAIVVVVIVVVVNIGFDLGIVVVVSFHIAMGYFSCIDLLDCTLINKGFIHNHIPTSLTPLKPITPLY